MNRYIAIGLSVAAALLLAACTRSHKGTAAAAPEESGSAYHKITAEEAKEMMDSGDVTVVDVRRAEEYEQAHIPGAVLAPNESIGEEQPEELPDKDAAILVHCRTGVRSKQASDKLVKMGYTNIYDFGGIVDWPYETEGGEAN